MIKFIASDLDGTILLNGAQSVDKSLIDVIDSLVSRGIIFAPASGRQVESLKMLFEPISDRLMYIAENGALVKYKGETIVKTAMDYNLAMDIIDDVVKIPSCEILASGEEYAYICPKTEEYLNRMTKVVKYKTKIVKDFREIDEDILKVAVCDLKGIDNSREYLINTWGDRAAATVSGSLYLDYMAKNVNKGDAVRRILDILSIKPEECMAFGDNYNDVEMLQSVYYSYVLEGAVDDVKRCGRFVTDSVEKTLRNIMEENMLEECAMVFLRDQGKLFDEPVADTVDEAKEFLEDCFAQCFDTIKEVREYLSEEGMDVDSLSDEELEEELEVFKLDSGKYLVVEA